MNIAMRFAAAIAAISLLAGCTSVSEAEFDSLHATLGSPAAKRHIIADCIAHQKRTPASEKSTYAAIMHVSPARYETTFCNRLFSALATGKITYADYRNLTSPTAHSSKVIRIMQGRY